MPPPNIPLLLLPGLPVLSPGPSFGPSLVPVVLLVLVEAVVDVEVEGVVDVDVVLVEGVVDVDGVVLVLGVVLVDDVELDGVLAVALDGLDVGT